MHSFRDRATKEKDDDVACGMRKRRFQRQALRARQHTKLIAEFGLEIMVALLFIGNNLITFAVQPLTTKILGGWIVGNLLEFAIAGAIVGAIYKPSTTATV